MVGHFQIQFFGREAGDFVGQTRGLVRNGYNGHLFPPLAKH
jgi:hypothetical protein